MVYGGQQSRANDFRRSHVFGTLELAFGAWGLEFLVVFFVFFLSGGGGGGGSRVWVYGALNPKP